MGNVPLPLHRDLAGSTNVIPQLEAGPASCMGMGWAHPLDLIMRFMCIDLYFISHQDSHPMNKTGLTVARSMYFITVQCSGT